MIKHVNLIFFVILIFLFSCSPKEEKTNENQYSFEEQVINGVDYVLDSTICNGGLDRIIQIRHQKYEGKNFVQIASVNDFYPDSLYYCTEYKGNFVAIYNEKFFKNKLGYDGLQMKNLLKKYDDFDWKNNKGLISDKRCFEIFEIKKGKFERINHNSFYYNNLFADSFIPEPPPAPKK